MYNYIYESLQNSWNFEQGNKSFNVLAVTVKTANIVNKRKKNNERYTRKWFDPACYCNFVKESSLFWIQICSILKQKQYL